MGLQTTILTAASVYLPFSLSLDIPQAAQQCASFINNRFWHFPFVSSPVLPKWRLRVQRFTWVGWSVSKELKIEQAKGFIGGNRLFLIKVGTAFAIWIWSIYACHTASRSNDCRTLEHYTSDQNPYRVARTIRSCWRSLSCCNSMLAHRVLMAATAQPQRLAEHTSITAASLQLNTSH